MHKWDPSDYAINSSAQEKWAVTLISRLKLKGNESILDIGCGDGRVTAILAARVPEGHVLGIDNSPEMINFAQSKFPPSLHANLKFELRDALSLNFNNEFDLATSFTCMHWIREHLTVLKGVKRGLRVGGRILFQFSGKGDASELFYSTELVMKDERWSKYFQNGFRFISHRYDPDEYNVLLDQVGFEVIRVELVPIEMIQIGRAGLEGFLRTTWLTFTERVPEDIRPQFIREIAERYLERHPLESGIAKVQMIKLEVEARLKLR